MQNLTQTLENYKEKLHHAYLVNGDNAKNKEEVESFIVNNFPEDEREDIMNFDFHNFGIDKAREINNLQNRNSSKKRFFIITSNSVTVETQNSLLKMFEEPAVGNYFFWILPDDSKILDTIKSRVVTIKAKVDLDEYRKEVEEFIKSDYKEREKYIEKYLGDSKKNIPADKTGAFNFISALEEHLIENKFSLDQVRETIKLKSYIRDRSSNIKYILEYFLSTLEINKEIKK